MPATFTRNLQYNRCPDWRIDTSESMWQSSDEAIEHRMIQLWGHYSCSIRRETNLLLVMPMFGQLACCIKPV
jgi:hypothetical protein